MLNQNFGKIKNTKPLGTQCPVSIVSWRSYASSPAYAGRTGAYFLDTVIDTTSFDSIRFLSISNCCYCFAVCEETDRHN